MSDTVHIEPGHRHRAAFAAWGLVQVPPIGTASASGWDVPLDLYPSVPTELLEGGYVDGFPYGGPDVPQPTPQAAEGPVQSLSKADTGAAARAERRTRVPRKKAAGRQSVSTAPETRHDDTAAVLMINDFGGTES